MFILPAFEKEGLGYHYLVNMAMTTELKLDFKWINIQRSCDHPLMSKDIINCEWGQSKFCDIKPNQNKAKKWLQMTTSSIAEYAILPQSSALCLHSGENTVHGAEAVKGNIFVTQPEIRKCETLKWVFYSWHKRGRSPAFKMSSWMRTTVIIYEGKCLQSHFPRI